MIERKGALWISTIDDWFKYEKLIEINAYDLWVSVEKIDVAERKGALPRAVAKLVEDTVFLSQGKTLEKITDQEIIQIDKMKLMSDNVDSMLLRFNLGGARLHYSNRFLSITLPEEGKMIMYDNIEDGFQPPQNIGITSLNYVGGELVGHSNATNTSFKMYTGRRDLATAGKPATGVPVEGKIAFGFNGDEHEFYSKMFSMIALQGRLTPTTKISVETEYEENGANLKEEYSFTGESAFTFTVTDDASLATSPFGSVPFAGAKIGETDLERFFAYKKLSRISYLEFRPIITITAVDGGDADLHLTGLFTDRKTSDRKIDSRLFISQT